MSAGAGAGAGASADAGLGATAEDEYPTAPPMDDLTRGSPGPSSATTAAAEQASTTATSPGAPGKTGGTTEVNGYVDSRSQFQRVWVGQFVPTADVPQLSELLEANVQLRHTFAPSLFVYADASAFAQFAGNFRGAAPDGTEIVIPGHDVGAYRPLFSLNELYASWDPLPQLNLTVGKKRVVWGPGFAFNPTDLINPPKDPTDPSLQRAGAFLARAELNLGSVALSVLGAAAVTEQANGIPYGLLRYPSWDAVDDQAHYLLAARLYALVANSDINLMVFYGNRFNDGFEKKLRFGLGFSRYFFKDQELHLEALVQQGSARAYPVPECVDSQAALAGCIARGQPPLDQTLLDDKAIHPRVLVGTRRQFDDESLLSVEYYFQDDGLTRSQFQQEVDLLQLGGGALATLLSTGSDSRGLPQKFTFDPLRKHYLIASYSKPKIFEDWTASMTVIASLNDLSTALAPAISWAPQDWLTLTLNGFIPTAPLTSLAATTSEGTPVGEFTLTPIRYRVLFEARVFY